MWPAMLTSDHSRPHQQTLTHTAQQTADRRLMLAAVQTLSIEHRVVLLDCYFRGASVAEAAATLGVPAAAIKSRTHHALRALRRALALSTNDCRRARCSSRCRTRPPAITHDARRPAPRDRHLYNLATSPAGPVALQPSPSAGGTTRIEVGMTQEMES